MHITQVIGGVHTASASDPAPPGASPHCAQVTPVRGDLRRDWRTFKLAMMLILAVNYRSISGDVTVCLPRGAGQKAASAPVP